MQVREPGRIAAAERRQQCSLGQTRLLGNVIQVVADWVAATGAAGPAAPPLTSQYFQRGFRVLLFDGLFDVVLAHRGLPDLGWQSVTTRDGAAASMLSRLHGPGVSGDLVQRLPLQPVKHPPPLFAIADQPSLLEHL